MIIENERATWTKVELTGKKDPTKKIKKKIEEIPKNDQKVDDTEEAVQNLQLEGTTKVVEEGAFTISRYIQYTSSQKSSLSPYLLHNLPEFAAMWEEQGKY